MKVKATTSRKSDFILLESFPSKRKSLTPPQSVHKTGLLIYKYERESKKTSHLVINSVSSEDLISYLAASSPEIYDALLKCMDRGSMFIDLEHGEAWNSNGPDIHEETIALLEALNTIALFPKRYIDISSASGIVSVILCGGKGSRMSSRDLHKICFPIAGRPAINRLIDQLESVGIHEHIVVVGEKGKQAVNEITDVRDNVTFVYQLNQNGTGNATKQAAYLLCSQGFKGTVLVVLGDKVIEKSALQRLLKNFSDSKADLALMTAEKKFWPDAGRILFDRKGQPIDIIEKHQIQKLILSKRLLELKRKTPKTSSQVLLKVILKEIPSVSKARTMFPDLMEYLEDNKYIPLKRLEEIILENQTHYTIQRGGETICFSGDKLEYVTPVSNAAVYLFSSDAFYNLVFKIRPDNTQKEEYLTEVIRLLNKDTERTWKIIPVPVKDHYEVMSYNNPEELLKIEEYYTKKESLTVSMKRLCERIDVTYRKYALRPVEEWIRIIDEFGPDIRNCFLKIYGDNKDILTKRRKMFLQTLQKFIKVYGTNNFVIIARSPAHINLMGRHVEHRGGFTNYMTINREVLLVAGIREDDVVEIHNVDSHRFRPRSFSIGEELSRLPWDEWLNMIDSNTVLEMIRSSRGDWSNYFKAAALRLQEKFKGRLLYGFNGVLSGEIPLAAGLSSSSAIVVSAAEVLTFINGFSFVPKEFVDLCGESEWFAGTREGSGNHAAMKFGEKGKIIHMGFHDIRVEDIISFPKCYRLIILQSHQHAKNPEEALQVFNEKVATYEVAQAIVKTKYPEYNERLIYFRDINTEHLGLKPYEIYDILLSIPEHITRKELMKILHEEDKDHMERIFSSHKEPSGGYKARRVALFGLSEIARAREFSRLIKKENVEEAGLLQRISHDGDRVSQLNNHGERVKYDNSTSNNYIRSLRDRLSKGDRSAALYLQPGGYGCSTPLIDEMVDIALSIDGVVGAQLSGAGLGGCIMALIKEDTVDTFQKTMRLSFYGKYDLPENMVVCSPIAGSGILSL